MSHIFISYSHKDKEYVHKLRAALSERGFDSWIDEGLEYGTQRWSREIERRLQECSAFVLVMSSHSQESEWVENELLAARDLKKPILPLLLTGQIWWSVRSIQVANVSNGTLPPESFFLRLARHQADAPKTGDVTIHVGGDVHGNIVVGNENRVKNEALHPIPFGASPDVKRGSTLSGTRPDLRPKKKIERGSPDPRLTQAERVPDNKLVPRPTRNLTGLAATLGACMILSLAGIWVLNNLPKGMPLPTSTAKPTIQATITRTPFPAEITQKGAVMLLIPAGSFMMGSNTGEDHEKPPHNVTLSAFYMDKYEVSNALYKACVDDNGCTAPTESKSSTRDSYYGNAAFDNYPVIYVDWNQAKTYCEWRGGRLPTEAEWEYAARGTDGRTYPWGEGIDNTRANYNQNTGDISAIDRYEPGKSYFGLYNMAGNVWEWVNDWYDGEYYKTLPSTNPQGPSTGQSKVVRGGAWYYYDLDLRSAIRDWYYPTDTNDIIGFRCARSP